MKYYISFILFSLFAMTFTSCNTDDLEKDIDELKDRVTNFETQVQQLNDEMNMIRVLLDGNKTITDLSINGDTYTLTLSNGETLTLTPGVVGGNYPSIEIGENGNWVVGGEDTGWRAEAEDGKDSSITPQFKIEANPADGGKKYWWVSYNEGATWEVLANGLAQGTNANTNPISGATVVGDNFKVTFGGQDYFIPIVKGLECAINVPEGVKDGIWSIAGGGASSFTVKVNIAEGDLVRVKAPIEWNAKLSSYAAGTKEVTVTVTPPVNPSECVIVVEVTHGVNTASDQMKAKTISDSNWAEYLAGFDVRIGDVIINKYDHPGGLLLTDGGKISANGVYFLAENAMIDWTGGTSNLIVVAEKKNNIPSLNIATSNGQLALGSDGAGAGLLFKSVKVYNKNLTVGYPFVLSENIIDKLYFDHCEIEFTPNKSFFYLYKGGATAGGVTDMLIESCRIAIPATSELVYLINYRNGKYQNLKIHNNIFYCSTSGDAVLFTIFQKHATEATVTGKVYCENNTCINLLGNHSGNSSGIMRATMGNGWTMKNNLFWYDTVRLGAAGAYQLVSHLMSGSEVANISAFDELFGNNKVFSTNTELTWQYFRTRPTGFTANALTVEKTTPFSAITPNEGKYTLKPEYKGIGATIE